jgi:UDP-GlcNAc:undecaprenyl-phosphate GlcNAc-1-phosphate transferase
LLLGFLVFNFYPAKIRSGAAGKSTFGFILAVLSLQSGAKMATAILILLLPITDFFIVLIRRYIVHRPSNPFHLLTISDKTHLHHRLLDFGLSERKVAYIEYIMTALLGSIALAISGTMKAFIFLSAVAVVSLFIVGIPIIGKRRKDRSSAEPPTPEARFSY